MNNDEHQQDYKDSREGELGADRMKIGLRCIPDPTRGDMEEVKRIDAELHTQIQYKLEACKKVEELEARLLEAEWLVENLVATDTLAATRRDKFLRNATSKTSLP